MRATIGFVGAAVTLATPAQTAAAPFDFFCSAPLNHYSQLRQIHAGPDYRVRGRLGPVRLERIPDPSQPIPIAFGSISRTADVTIMNEQTNDMLVLVLAPRYQAASEATPVADVYVQTLIDGEDRSTDLTTLGGRGLLWEDLPFEIVVRETAVTVTAGGRQRTIEFRAGRNAALELSCLGGSFHFDDVDWDG